MKIKYDQAKAKLYIKQFKENPSIETARPAFVVCHETDTPFPNMLLDTISYHFREEHKKLIDRHVKVIERQADQERDKKGILLQCALECESLEEAFKKFKSIFPEEGATNNGLRKRLERYVDKNIKRILLSSYRIDLAKELPKNTPNSLARNMCLTEKLMYLRWLSTD